jgi:ribose transport system substrate-binding protein
MKTRKIVALLVAVIVVLAYCTACAPAATGTAEPASAEPAAEDTAPAAPVESATAAGGGEPAEADGSGSYELKPGDWSIGLSNSYYGNTWRKQMVDNFNEAAKKRNRKG